MMYKGYEIRETSKQLRYCKYTGQGIYDGERLVSIAGDVAIAKRAIDAHTRAGIWRQLAGEKPDKK